MAGSELGKRVLVAVIGIPIAVAVIHVGGLLLGGMLALLAAGAALELYRLASLRGVAAFTTAGAVAAALLVLLAALVPAFDAAAPLFVAVALLLLLFTAASAVWQRPPERQPLAAVSVTLFGALYTGGTLAFALFLRHLAPPSVADPVWQFGRAEAWLGTALVFFPLVLTWVNDSFAYFAGRRWGRRKLIPSVSPGKTVVGGVAGLIGALLAGLVYSWILGQLGVRLPYVWGAVGGVVIGAVAQVGDLTESLFKREAGVKDSGALLPGHGGLLDRFDALFFSIPVAYVYLGLVLSASAGGGV